MSDSANPFAPPQAEVRDIPASALVLAGRGQRLGAAMLDSVIAFALFFAVNAAFSLDLFAREQQPNVPLLMLVGLGLFIAVQGWPLVKRGQTLGKMALGLRIVRTDGSRVGAGRMLGLRYGIGVLIGSIPLVGSLYALIDSLLIFRESRKCLHDNIADTIVVKA